jgi:uncharacterized protein with FMN-binding domain
MLSFACKEYEDIVIEDVALNSAQDGVYSGEYNTTLVKATVKVNIKDNIIQDVEIVKHQCGKGKKAEAVVDRVVQNQSLKVDAISGATYSSKVILKAIEKAVRKSTLSN